MGKLFSTLLAVSLVACGHSADGQVQDAADLLSFSLTATPSTIPVGATSQLVARFISGTAVVTPNVGPVTSGVPVTVQPAVNTRYTLTVTTATRTITRSVTVTVTDPSRQVLVYDDALAPNWQDWSWVTDDLANPSPVSSGTRSIAVSYGPYTGLSFLLPGGISGAGAGTLEFDVDGGATANPAINAIAQVGGVWKPEVRIAQYCAGGAIPAGAFAHCSVPLAALKAANVTFERIAFKEAAGLTLPTVYFDQIAVFPAATATTPPPPPAIQGFTASAGSVVAGGSVTLSATYSGGSGVVDQGVGPIASGASATVTPAATTTYTLTVSNAAGRSASAAVTVTVTAPPPPPPPPPPAIQTFTSSAASVVAGGSVTLSATYSGGTGVIDQGVGPIASGASATVTPAVTTTYTLTVTNAAGQSASAAVTVTVTAPPPPPPPPPPPAIQSFTSSAASVVAGSSVTLSATYSGGAGVIDHAVGAVASGASVTVTPAASTTYTLTVTNSAGQSASAAVTVAVTAPPAIQSFTDTPSSITAGASATLSATYTGGTGTIDQAVGAIASGGSVTVRPAATTTYTLTVSDTSGHSATKAVTLTVTAPPAIQSFAASATSIFAGGNATLSATYSGGTGSIDQGIGALSSGASVTVLPTATTTYTLTVTSPAGVKVTSAVTITVTPVPSIQSFTASASSIATGGSATLTATYSNGTGSIDQGVGPIASGASVAVSPAATTTYTLTVSDTAGHLATAAVTVAVGLPSITNVIPAQRLTVWNPGIPGGVPSRTTVCATVNASSFGNGSVDATAGIQAAIDACPEGQVLMLSAGEFKLTSPLEINKGIVLRGAGSTQTRLRMGTGIAWNLITLGTQWGPKFTQSVNLASDGVKGTNTVTLASNPGLKVGEIVEIDQLTDTSITEWNPTRSPPGDVSRTWFTRPNRPVGQMMEIQSINGNVLTFTTPFHITFQTAFTAQLSRFSDVDNGSVVPVVKFAGIENLYVYGGGDGNIRFSNAAYSWLKNVESDFQKGESIAIDGSFRCVIRDSYFHSTQDPNPGGGGYGISFSFYSSDNLVENNISWNMNKVMVMRASGGGNVIGYNYMEDGWISFAANFVEIGLNASHMTTPHYELFEGNESFNFDGDNTWGNAVFITAFRNHMTGKRRSIPPLAFQDANNVRAIGLGEGHMFYSFVGNVLGSPGQDPSPYTSYIFETFFPWNDSPVGMWRLGYNNDNWNATADPRVTSTIIREGNYDYVTNLVHWSGASQPLPASLYLTSKPAFFGTNPWPWVDPAGTSKLSTLPARARFDACGSTKTFCP